MYLQLTEWFPPNIKPVHIGEYEVKTCGCIPTQTFRVYWNGDIFQSIIYREPLLNQNRIWRGVLK